MGVDLEPVGALATAGLVAKEIEGHAGGAAHGAHAASTCASTGAMLAKCPAGRAKKSPASGGASNQLDPGGSYKVYFRLI
jgi:hypothetical protein